VKTIKVKEWNVVFIQVNYQLYPTNRQYAGLRLDQIFFLPISQEIHELRNRQILVGPYRELHWISSLLMFVANVAFGRPWRVADLGFR